MNPTSRASAPRIPIARPAPVAATVSFDGEELDDDFAADEESDPGMSVPGPAAIAALRPRPIPIPISAAPPQAAPVVLAASVEIDLDDLEEVDAEEADDEPSFDLGARDDETDGFHLPADGPTRFPTNTRSDPGLGPVIARPGPALGASRVQMPAGAGDASSLGDGWFGPGGASATAPSSPGMGPATGPGVALDAPVLGAIDVDAAPSDDADPDDGPDEVRPLRIPPLQLSVAQRVAPVAIAMMVVSLAVWTVVQIWT